MNEAAITQVDFDTIGTELWKDTSSGSLFVVDEGDSKSDRKQILDEGGYEPQLEYSDSWEGGSHDSTVVAVEKTAMVMPWRLSTKQLYG